MYSDYSVRPIGWFGARFRGVVGEWFAKIDMAQRKIRNSWWVDITHNKKRYRKKSPENTKEGARKFEMSLRRKLAEGEEIEEPVETTQSFREFAELWFATHVEVHNKPSMAKKTRGILDRLLIPTFGANPIGDIATLEVEKYKLERVRSGMSNKTINSELGVLGKCLRDAKKWIGIEKIPEITPLKLAPTHFDFLSKEECDRLLSNLEGIWYDIVYTALKTGLRRGELEALRWQDVQLDKKTVLVRHNRCSVTNELLSPKGNSVRSVPLSDDVVELLKRRQREEGFVFGVDGQMFEGRVLNRKIAVGCNLARLRVVTCHVLRHTFASHLAMKGVPIIVIQKLLGHTDLKVTMRYAHLSQESLYSVTQVMQTPFAPSTSKAA